MLFVGSTGIGKTYTANLIADTILDSDRGPVELRGGLYSDESVPVSEYQQQIFTLLEDKLTQCKGRQVGKEGGREGGSLVV